MKWIAEIDYEDEFIASSFEGLSTKIAEHYSSRECSDIGDINSLIREVGGNNKYFPCFQQMIRNLQKDSENKLEELIKENLEDKFELIELRKDYYQSVL